MYYVYALYNKLHNRTYIGQTNNLSRRLFEHNTHTGLGARSTASFNGEWTLIYQEGVTSRSVALKREHQLKSYQGRRFIRSLI